MPLRAPMVIRDSHREKRAEVKAVCMHGVVTRVYYNGKLVVFRCCKCKAFLESLR